jgi:hypothetical protein
MSVVAVAVAQSYSAPTFPAACGSRRHLLRPKSNSIVRQNGDGGGGLVYYTSVRDIQKD